VKPSSRDSHGWAVPRNLTKSNGLGEESGEKERPSPSESLLKSSTAFGTGGSLKKTDFYDFRRRRTLILQPAWLTDDKTCGTNTETACIRALCDDYILGPVASYCLLGEQRASRSVTEPAETLEFHQAQPDRFMRGLGIGMKLSGLFGNVAQQSS
jgi:hypothetical protein